MPEPGTPPVLVFDAPVAGGRSLGDEIRTAGFPVQELGTLEALELALGAAATPLCVVAFEALWPSPQDKLKALRARGPSAKLVLAHAVNSPRLRLAERLWGAGLVDVLVSRGASAEELREVLRQAASELRQRGKAGVGGPLQALHGVSAALANQRTVKGLVRELAQRLRGLVPYVLMQVYLPTERGRHVVHQFQLHPLEHRHLFGLLERTCGVLGVAPETVDIEASPPASPEAHAAGALEALVVPMTLQKGQLGALALMVPSPGATSQSELVDLLSYQLTTALQQVQMLEAAEQSSLIDELTQTHNRRYLTQALDTEWRRAQRYQLQLSVAMIDVDHFKRLNDVYGHSTGDLVLKELARFLKEHLRETDQLVRYGGEEFVALMPETGPAEAAMVLERVRILVGSRAVFQSPEHGPIQVSFSGGVAGFPASPVDGPEALLREADKALYTAKRAGRDRVCIAAIPGGEVVQAEVDTGERAVELRQFPRIPTRMHVRFLELPDFESSMARVTAADISAGGIAITGDVPLKKNAYALVFLEDALKPVLTRVMWTQSAAETHRAGLRFVQAKELDELATRATAMGVTEALVIARSPETRNMVSRVLRAAQYKLTLVEQAADLPSEAELEKYGLIVLGDSALRESLGGQLAGIRRLTEKTRIVVINETQDRKEALDTLVSTKVRHMVTADESSSGALFATLNKLLLGEYFGIRKYLLWGARSRSWSLSYGENKQEVLDGVKAVAQEVRCHPRIADLLVMAVDEMIINALYRAPPSEGAPSKPVMVECGSDGRLLVVSVLDEHGRLKAEDLYAGLGQALRADARPIPAPDEHAHLGFKIMLDALSQLAINVEPGRRTEIIGIVDLRKSLKEYRSSVPTFDMFSRDES